MRKAYRILADIIAIGVAVQSMAMVWAIAGLFHWIESDGGSIDKATLDRWEDHAPDFQGAVGFAIHGIAGMMIIPVIGLALLVIAFFADVEGGVKWAAVVAGSIIVQVLAGVLGEDAPWVGLVHGLNAFVLFSAAIMAARAAHPAENADAQTAMAATP